MYGYWIQGLNKDKILEIDLYNQVVFKEARWLWPFNSISIPLDKED